jgi:hypothetical protein
MNVAVRIAVCVLAGTNLAWAQHHHDMERHDGGGDHSVFGAGVGLVAGSFDTTIFAGNYQGVLPNLQWAYSRFGLAVSGAMYRLEENGATFYGIGDLLVHGQVGIARNEHGSVGLLAGMSAPIGDEQHGMGMGHMMVMPAAYGTWAIDRLSLTATAGYSRAIGAMHHDHGPWPLVEPMLASELSWSAGADLLAASNVRTGARVSGGVPIDAMGGTRAIGALRVVWHAGRVDSAAEIQAGLAGDPFTVRGVVSTALSF